MSLTLTKEQQAALDAESPIPPQIVDPRTNQAYVLIPAAEYESIREIIDDERRQQTIRTIAVRNAASRMQDDS